MLASKLLLLSLATSALTLPLSLSSPFTLLQRQSPELEAETDRLLFSVSIESFLAARAAQDPAGLDWSSDGCSSSPDNPFGFNFQDSCYRHDFGYRNYKAQSRFTDANKARIDDKFRADLFNECAKEEDMGILAEKDVSREVCEATATVYYAAVTIFGRKEKL